MERMWGRLESIIRVQWQVTGWRTRTRRNEPALHPGERGGGGRGWVEIVWLRTGAPPRRAGRGWAGNGVTCSDYEPSLHPDERGGGGSEWKACSVYEPALH